MLQCAVTGVLPAWSRASGTPSPNGSFSHLTSIDMKIAILYKHSAESSKDKSLRTGGGVDGSEAMAC
jgi:hypothetical protein